MPVWLPHWPWLVWAVATLTALVVLILEGSYRVNRSAHIPPLATSDKASIEALAAHTEELRLQRLTRDRENNPIERALRDALGSDPVTYRPSLDPVSTSAPSRINLKDFLSRAHVVGWDISGKTNAEIMDLLQGVRQAALDGTIRMWGRRNRNRAEMLARREPLIEIDRNHWADYEIDTFSVMASQDNFGTASYNKRARSPRDGGFLDLHLDALAAEIWLNGSAAAYKGTFRA